MNIHQNARTTPYSRLLMARRVAAGEKIVKVATDFCISQQTVRKCVQRWRNGGVGALQDRSSRPHRLRSMAPERLAAIERLRRQRLSSPAIARQLGLPISTVTKIVRRLGLNRLKVLDPPVARLCAISARVPASCCILTSRNSAGSRALVTVSPGVGRAR